MSIQHWNRYLIKLKHTRACRQWAVGVVKFVVRSYQLLVSPVFGPACRFFPSCSQYAIEALDRYGLFKGGYLAARRLLRCHPWNDGGFDPVP